MEFWRLCKLTWLEQEKVLLSYVNGGLSLNN